jgi:iron complex outermembrane receptor protein
MAGYGWQHFWRKLDTTSYGVKPGTTESIELSTPYHFESEYYLLSLYGRANYSLYGRYLLTATLRADASSRFAKNNRWGYFPSVALAWRLIEEDFMKEQTTLSDLKIRVGYGLTGQQDIINDYPWMTTFSISYPESSYQFGDKWYQTYRPNGYDNDIKWESTTTWNVGVDYGFINNRLYGSVDYYKRFTKNLLNTISVPSGTNFAPVITTNIGSMENQGVEFSINAVPVETKDWRWSIGFNYTWQKSKITKLNTIDSENNFVNTGAISGTGKTVQVFMVDKTPYTFYLAQQAYDEAGNPIEGQYVQPDGSISSTETKYASDKSALPTSLIGFNTNLSYKNWDLGISGHGSFGNYIYNYVKADQYLQSAYSDQGSFSNLLQSTVATGFDNQQLYSDYWLENGSFFRIDNITLGYTFNHLWNKSSSLRLSFNVSNLCTFTGYSGIDPEIYSGIDREVYPRPRTYTFGLNLNF